MATQAVVIGAGITGALVALELQRLGLAVTLVDGKHVGAGSSSRTAAGIRQQFSTPETVLGMRYAVDYYGSFAQRVQGDRPALVRSGYLFLLEGEAQLSLARTRVDMQTAAGLHDVLLLDPAQVAERFAWVDAERISGATFCPSDGFLYPDVIYNDAVAALRRLGGHVLQGQPVHAARQQGSRLQAVAVGPQWLSADFFADCTNAWSPRLAQVLGAQPLPVAPTKRYLWFIDRGRGMTAQALSSMPLVVTPSGTYCRPESSDSLMVGSAHVAAAEPDFSYEDQDRVQADFFHRAGAAGKAVEAWLNVADYLPPVGDFGGLTATTCGYYAVTPDHNPFLGFDGIYSNLLRLVGFSGHGAMFGPFTAAVAAAHVAAGRGVDAVEVLGRAASLTPFSLQRRFSVGEGMVI